MMTMSRPFPPIDMADSFMPSPELEQWARSSFIDPGAVLQNMDHEHLQQASLGFVWTVIMANRGGRRLAGQCEAMPPAVMGKWPKERAVFQIEQWFGKLPDFLITIDAGVAVQMDDTSFCALIEHELYHAGQERDIFGGPKFTRDGAPRFAVRAHDIEEFRGVVRRYGAGVTDLAGIDTKAKPEIGPASVREICGTCIRLVA